jgi:hypothetical protein
LYLRAVQNIIKELLGRRAARNMSNKHVEAQRESSANGEDPSENSMRSFLNQMGESQREALEKIFDSSIDNSCLPSCENQLENQFDLLMVRLVTIAWAAVIDYPYADTTAPLLYYLALSATIEFLTIL